MATDIQAQVAKAAAKLKEISIRANTGVEKTIEKYGLVVESAAKRSFKGRGAQSIYNEPPRVDTGRLRASITHRGGRDDDGYFQEIGTNVEYAADVEFGTSDTMPHPFLGYALGMYAREIERSIAEAVQEAGRA